MRDPVAKRLALEVLAGHGRTVGGDADGSGQSRARRNLGTHLFQYARELLHVGGGSPSKSLNPGAEGIAAPAHYSSIVGDAIGEALICGPVRECAQFDQPALVGIKERNPIPVGARGLSSDLGTIAVHSRGLADGLAAEKQLVLSTHPAHGAAGTGGILPKADNRLSIGRDGAGPAAMVAGRMSQREIPGLRCPLEAFRSGARPGKPDRYLAIAAYSVATAPAVADLCAAVVGMTQVNQAARVP